MSSLQHYCRPPAILLPLCALRVAWTSTLQSWNSSSIYEIFDSLREDGLVSCLREGLARNNSCYCIRLLAMRSGIWSHTTSVPLIVFGRSSILFTGGSIEIVANAILLQIDHIMGISRWTKVVASSDCTLRWIYTWGVYLLGAKGVPDWQDGPTDYDCAYTKIKIQWNAMAKASNHYSQHFDISVMTWFWLNSTHSGSIESREGYCEIQSRYATGLQSSLSIIVTLSISYTDLLRQ